MHELNLNKLKLQTANKINENIEKLAQLFPNIISEKKDGNIVKKAVDFDLLRQILSENIVEGDDERYRLDWPGKKASLLKANTPIKKTLRPCTEESKDFENTQNLYIEGDNFEVLKLLQESYLSKIKMIYIDPPYNTGKDFVYRDNFKESKEDFEEKIGLKDEEENKLFKNTDSNGRFHSDWLSMMYERLLISRDLLKDDGVIFISIDDNEVHNLRKICDEVFGEGNFVSEFVWQKNFAPKNDNKYISISHETILCFTKNKDKFNRNLLPREEKHNKGYSNPDDDIRGIWTSGSILATTFSESGVFEIIAPNDTKHFPPNGRCWRYSKLKIVELINDNKLWFGKDGNGVPRVKRFLTEMPDGIVPQSWLKYEEVGSGQDGTQLTKTIFKNTQIFDFPKPLMLIKRFLHIGTNKDDLILDFFSGSSTTAHAVMDLNAKDGGNRKYIMVQLPEPTDEKSEAFKAGYKNICEIGKERIRRAGDKIIGDEVSTSLEDGTKVATPDIGFRVLKTDSSNFKDVYYHPNDLGQQELFNLESNIKEDRDELDLLFQIMLDLGVELSLKIKSETIDNSRIYILENSELIACFSENISLNTIQIIQSKNPYKVVLKDGCFANDTQKINAIQSLSLSTSVSVI